MPDDSPTHSPDSFFEGASPVQTFVDVWRPLDAEKLNRPRLGRPVRRPADPPVVGDANPPATPGAGGQPD